MIEVDPQLIQQYRIDTYRSQPNRRLKNADDAEKFVNERGFVFLYANQNLLLPSLWVATAGDRPVPKEHHDPGQVIWDWKDSSLGKRRWHYARLLHRRNSLLSLAILPHFYALSPNYGEPESDYLDQYAQGQMTRESFQVYEALLQFGPMDTLALREAARMTSSDSYGRFNRALEDLQMEFKMLPVGISKAGAWNYAFIYDLVHRHYPDLIEQAGKIPETDARDHILLTYLKSVGAASRRDITKITGWKVELLDRSIRRLCESGQVIEGVTIAGVKDSQVILSSLVS